MTPQERELGGYTYPRDPSTTPLPKSHLPRRLQTLKVLIGLEEGAHTERIDASQNNKQNPDILASLRVDERVEVFLGLVHPRIWRCSLFRLSFWTCHDDEGSMKEFFLLLLFSVGDDADINFPLEFYGVV